MMYDTNPITRSTHGTPADWHTKTGPIGFHMCNDYLFRIMMQNNTDILSLLIRSLLKLDSMQPFTVEILNPIEPGRALGEKEFILDLKILFDNQVTVNVELQFWPQPFWKERALVYLSRIFDSLDRGDTYDQLRQCIHIGILNFPLSDLTPEFYAEYLFQNRRNGEVFSDKMQLNVLCLQHMNLATEEDIRCGLLMWARYFNAATWEDLKMLVKEYPVMEKTVSEASRLSEERYIREMMELREEGMRVRRTEEAIYRRAQENLKKTREDLESKQKDLEKTQGDLEKTQEDLKAESRRADQAEERLRQLEQWMKENNIDPGTPAL